MSNILTEDQGKTRVITINRPDKLNALNRATIADLSQAIKAAEADTAIRVIVLTGSGTKAFVAGADISEFAHFGQEDGRRLAADGQERLFDLIEKLSKPVIAAVNGFALGGGLELAMACHVRIASSNAKMGLPEVSLGVIPGYGGTQRLPQLVGKGRALEMILSAGMATAEEAQGMGLVNRVVEQEALLQPALILPAPWRATVRMPKRQPSGQYWRDTRQAAWDLKQKSMSLEAALVPQSFRKEPAPFWKSESPLFEYHPFFFSQKNRKGRGARYP